jgi:hypothetical protein
MGPSFQVALLFLFFRKQRCGLLANSRFLAGPTPITNRPADPKPPGTAPTKPFNRMSNSLPPDLRVAIIEVFLSMIPRARI